MSDKTYRLTKWTTGYELASFDCGEPFYNEWLVRHAEASVRSGVCAVYLLLEQTHDLERVVGYFAISPTQVLRTDVPGGIARGWPQAVPAWKLGKLAVHRDLRGDTETRWGRQLLREALQTLVRVADAGGGKVIVVDAANAALIGFYARNGFTSTGIEGDLSLCLKVSTARKALLG